MEKGIPAMRFTKQQHEELRRRSKPPTPERQQRMVDDWNQAHKQLGTKVCVLKDDGSTVETIATSQAYLLSGHTAVIFLHGIVGAYCLARVTAL